ncbi:MAG: ATP-binding cassette domain-containing protein [Emergencia sp.]|nr:ATP-binding cassette domain-containing protein [Emergencia sp.]
MEKIRIEQLNFTYPLSENRALTDISCTINKSEFVVVCGKSGCGKSTLLRHLKKQMMPYGKRSGSVFIDGVEIEDIEERRGVVQVGFIQQNPEAQIVTDKVWHELAFGLENLGLANHVIKRRVAEMANYFGIQTWFRKDVNELSGGQKQLLNLASVMVMQPEVLVLDEPTSQLDPIATSDFLNTLHKINKELGTTIVISEHRLEEIIPVADKVMVMDQSRIVVYDKPEHIGEKLYDEDQAKRHPMFDGMPTVIRIFQSLNDIEGSPLTIRDGRLLLEEKLQNVRQVNPAQELVEGQKNEIAFSLKDLWFKYDKESPFVLRGAALAVEKGQWHCMLGGNGAGKSTVLKALCGAIKIQRGKIKVADECKLAMVPQNPQALFTEITAEEELFEGTLSTLTEEEKIAEVEEMLTIMEIEHLRTSNPYDLSGGEQQRLAIGKVLLTRPDILLLDEPTKGLDPFFKKTLAGIFSALQKRGITIFMVSHDIEFCAEYGQICSMFFDGEIVSADRARPFFAGNSFYTTAANKLLRNWNPQIVTGKEAEEWLKEII